MCEMLLSMVIVGFMNVGPDTYLVQGQDLEGNVVECEMIVTPKENDKNVSDLFTY